MSKKEAAPDGDGAASMSRPVAVRPGFVSGLCWWGREAPPEPACSCLHLRRESHRRFLGLTLESRAKTLNVGR
jgi:hypothetical protein